MGSWVGVYEEMVVFDGRRDDANNELLETSEGRRSFSANSIIIRAQKCWYHFEE